MYNSGLTYLFNVLDFQLKFESFDLRTKFNELIIESNLKRFSSRFDSLVAIFWDETRVTVTAFTYHVIFS